MNGKLLCKALLLGSLGIVTSGCSGEMDATEPLGQVSQAETDFILLDYAGFVRWDQHRVDYYIRNLVDNVVTCNLSVTIRVKGRQNPNLQGVIKHQRSDDIVFPAQRQVYGFDLSKDYQYYAKQYGQELDLVDWEPKLEHQDCRLAPNQDRDINAPSGLPYCTAHQGAGYGTSYSCSDGTCAKTDETLTDPCVIRPSGGCAADADCGSGNYCASGTCQTGRALGSTCSANRECTTNRCEQGTCREQQRLWTPVPSGQYKSTNGSTLTLSNRSGDCKNAAKLQYDYKVVYVDGLKGQGVLSVDCAAGTKGWAVNAKSSTTGTNYPGNIDNDPQRGPGHYKMSWETSQHVQWLLSPKP